MMRLSGRVYYTWDDVKDICSLDLRTHQATSFREAQYPCLVVFLLIIAALSLSSMSFLSLLQNMSSSSSFSQYVWSPLFRIVHGSLLMVYLRAPEIHWCWNLFIDDWPCCRSSGHWTWTLCRHRGWPKTSQYGQSLLLIYDYDDATAECSEQQRASIVLVAKCGNSFEADDAKPSNCGKRDRQIVLMALLQKVMFDERITTNFSTQFEV